MTEPERRDQRKTVVWIAAAAGGCLVLLVLVVGVLAFVWWMRGERERETIPPTAVETATLADSAPAGSGRASGPALGPAGGVTLRGRLVDAETGAPVVNAFVFLYPGGDDDPLLGASDAGGVFEVPGVERGRTYAAEFAANGYMRTRLPEGLTVPPDAPAVMEMQDFPLQPE